MKPEVKQRNQAVQWLLETFPKAFKLTDRKPLVLSILEDIQAKNLPNTPSSPVLQSALDYYQNWGSYLSALQAGTARVDLDGKPAAQVTLEEEQTAQSKLTDAQQKLNAK